jgi:nitroreductase/NAD-dependent dihydropyrimidine dehydrogenase PreA subunit
MIQVDVQSCARDGLCIEVCPMRLLQPGPDRTPVARPDAAASCAACGHCVAVCRRQALRHERLPFERFTRAQAREAIPGEAVDGLLRSRRSCREYRDEPLTRPEVEALLDTVRHAPTANNSQLLRWIATSGPATTRALAARVAESLRGDERFAGFTRAWDEGCEVVFRGAPHVLIALAPADYPLGMIDCATAIAYLELSAHAHGYGTCWAGAFTVAANHDPELTRSLALPAGYAVRGGVMLGRPRHGYVLVPPRKETELTWLD